MEMVLDSREAALIQTFRRLPAEAADEISALVERLSAVGRPINWSDEWSDEDLGEFRAASLNRLDRMEAEGD